MKFILLPAGSGGFCLEQTLTKWLSKWFPPRLTPLDPEGHKQVLAYQYRVNRKGVERHPTQLAGAKIVSVVEGPPSHHVSRMCPGCFLCKD